MIKYIILLLTLTGCTGLESINLHSDVAVDSSFTQDELITIQNGINQWEVTTNNLIKINLFVSDTPENNKVFIIKDDNNSYDPINGGNAGYTFVSSDQSAYTILYTKNNVENNVSLLEIVMHEFGHALGLAHESTGLMTPSPHNQTCIDQNTINQFCNLHNCVRLRSNCN